MKITLTDSTLLSPVEAKEYETLINENPRRGLHVDEFSYQTATQTQMRNDIELIDWELIHKSGGLEKFAKIVRKDDLLGEGEALRIDDV